MGTQSARFVVFDEEGKCVTQYQKAIPWTCPRPGWIEQDPDLLVATSREVMDGAVHNLIQKKLLKHPSELAERLKGIGVTNQRETTILWDSETGEALHPAIVWKDIRCEELMNQIAQNLTEEQTKMLEQRTGLRLSTYFSALKIRWLIDSVPQVKEAVEANRCMFGTVDSWFLWKISRHTTHVTDVTNASRTLLCDIHTACWDQELLDIFQIPSGVKLPEIRSSAEEYCVLREGNFHGVPVVGCLGDQQAALLGNLCIKPGMAKNTYGTGCFTLYNTGTQPVHSQFGLLTTIAYQLGPKAPLIYALEGSINAAGSAVTWLKDKIQVIDSPEEINIEAAKVEDTNGIYFVPAFTGIFAPRWRSDARGVLVGLTGQETKSHLCRAVLEAICFQTKEILDAMRKDAQSEISILKVDGGMTKSDILLQMQADILGANIERGEFPESTSLGAAIAAGVHLGIYRIEEDDSKRVEPKVTLFTPKISEELRTKYFKRWNRAVERALGWTLEDE